MASMSVAHTGVLIMTATIKLLVRSGSGVLSKVASQLQTQGLRVKSHDLQPVNDSSVMLTLNTVSQEEIDEAGLKTLLADIDVVLGVEEISRAVSTAAQTTPAVEVPAELVERLVSSFPKVMSHIQNYEENIAKDPLKTDKLKRLGLETGHRLGNTPEADAPESLQGLIDDVVLPGIAQLAEASRDGETIVVPISLFTRRVVTSMDLIGGDDEQCYFLCGLIEGLAGSRPGYESVSVVESSCRANGDSTCVFSLS